MECVALGARASRPRLQAAGWRAPQTRAVPGVKQLSNSAKATLLLRDPLRVIRGPIEEPFDRPSQRQLLVQLGGLLEIDAQALGFGKVLIAQPGLDLELRILLRQRAHPLLDLAAAILVAGSVLQ